MLQLRNQQQKQMTQEIIKELENWAEEREATETEVIRAARQIFPSWKLTREIKYGCFRRNGWRQNIVQLYKGTEIIHIHFWDYDEYWDQGR